MTWTERMKAAWATFKREAFPLYGWTIIFIFVGGVLSIAMLMGVLSQYRWALPQMYNAPYSSGMPVPGMPPTPGFTPYNQFGPFGANGNPFGSNQNPFGSHFGPFSDLTTLMSFAGNLIGVFILMTLVFWILGSLFYAGMFNLTAKAYRGNVSFKDFRFTGFFRILGWQGFLVLASILIMAFAAILAVGFRQSPQSLTVLFIIYWILITLVMILLSPWLVSSNYYILAHQEQGFWDALKGSWRFFRRHMGALWGYIGTVILFEIALQVVTRISHGLGTIAALVVSPFIAILAIVWVLTLEDQDRGLPFTEQPPRTDLPNMNPPTSPSSSTSPISPAPAISPSNVDPEPPAPQAPPIPPSPSEDLSAAPSPSNERVEPIQDVSEERSYQYEKYETSKIVDPADPFNIEQKTTDDSPKEISPAYCPSCGKANTGTVYCPQCGTKL